MTDMAAEREHIEVLEVEGTAEKKATDWLDILGSGDLKKKVIRAGIVESRPTRGDVVQVKVIGKLKDGSVVDSHPELFFSVGEAEVISGLDLIVPLMDRGEKAEVFMSSRFAYGEKGLNGEIAADTDLYYTVTLVDFQPEPDPMDLSVEERMAFGERKRERGNWWFNREDYQSAIRCYHTAVNFLDDTTDSFQETTDDVKELIEVRLKVQNNMAAAQLKTGALDAALRSVDAVLKCQPMNAKALFRKGKILSLQGEHREGISFLKQALILNPGSRVILQELGKAQEKARQSSDSERGLYRRMFGGPKEVGNEGSCQPKKHPVILKDFPFMLFFTCFVVSVAVLVGYKFRDQLSFI